MVMPVAPALALPVWLATITWLRTARAALALSPRGAGSWLRFCSSTPRSTMKKSSSGTGLLPKEGAWLRPRPMAEAKVGMSGTTAPSRLLNAWTRAPTCLRSISDMVTVGS
jgi:hypothetical protein